jgi:hypothetical protein
MSWIYYLLEANLYLVLFYAVYYFVLRRETYYQLNRGYLMSICVIAFIIPLLQIGTLRKVPPSPIVYQTITPVNTYTWTRADYCLLLYITVAAVMLTAFIIKLHKLIQLSRKAKQHNNGFYLIEIADNNNAFSFFKYLFIDPKLSNSPAVVQHELVHIRQKHSLDIVFLELFKVVNWFNPVVYLLQNSVKELHEFIADQETATQQQDVNGYTDFLINSAYGFTESHLANNFFNKNLLKTRIIMLHQKRSGSLARLKLLVTLPLLGGMLCLSTLGFTKDYSLIDLAPAQAKQVPPPPPVAVPNKPQTPPPPPPVKPHHHKYAGKKMPPPPPPVQPRRPKYVGKQMPPPPPKVSKVHFPPPVVKPDADDKLAPPPPPKVSKVRFPPPMVKPDGKLAPPKPKVTQIRFPPPIVKPGTTPPAPKEKPAPVTP